MPIHHNPAGILRKLPAVLAAFALIMASTVAVDQEPASAACVRHGHLTWPNDGWLDYSWARDVPLHHESTCNDVNVASASHTVEVMGQYQLRNGRWSNGNAGFVEVRAGVQRPWRVLVRNLRNGTPYRVATQDPWKGFSIGV